ncbi:hypothetical protein CUC08_Gglean002687 [Alternaria sp. MG1]|jgi:hypothetical protein|nr:hypothetical protein CUC08_Gglean002687 [Alternaria sp. MG1]
MQTDVVQPARAAVAANETHEENESPSSRPRSISVSRFFPNLKSPREPNVKGHRKTQSENIAGQTATTNIEGRTPPRRNRSAVNSLSLGVECGQQIDQGSEVKKTQSQEPEKTGKPIRTAVFDRPRLDHQLVVALKDDDSTHRKFLPNGDLARLVTQELVDRELSRSKKEYFATKILRRSWLSSNKYVRVEPSMEHEYIRHGQVGLPDGAATQPDVPCYQKVFAILMFMGRQRKIKAFVKEQVCDTDLPLEVKNFELRRRSDDQSVLKCLKEPSDIEQFVTFQWRVLARTFHKTDDGKHPHFEATVNEVLPFTSWKFTGRWGASGKVYKAEVHPDHHAFDEKEESGVCRNFRAD